MGPLGSSWLRAEKEREPWRDAHRFLEWDGWEEGLLETVIGDKAGALPYNDMSANCAPASRVGVGGTFKMGNGFIGLSLT